MLYVSHDPIMIRSFRDAATERFAGGGRSRFSGLDEQKARLRLDQLNAAVTPPSMGALKSVGSICSREAGRDIGRSPSTVPGVSYSGLQRAKRTMWKSWSITEADQALRRTRH